MLSNHLILCCAGALPPPAPEVKGASEGLLLGVSGLFFPSALAFTGGGRACGSRAQGSTNPEVGTRGQTPEGGVMAGPRTVVLEFLVYPKYHSLKEHKFC